MLKYRILTALVLIPLVFAFIFYMPPLPFVLVLFALILLCGWEWVQLIPLKKYAYFFPLLLAVANFLAYRYPDAFVISGAALWLLMIFAIFSFPKTQHYWGKPTVLMILGWVFMPLCFVSLTYLHLFYRGNTLFVYLLLLVWASDTGAYIAGKYFGKRRLIPAVSPNKTWAGLIGGVALAAAVSCAAFVYFGSNNATLWAIQAAATVFMATIGDLFISMLKRRVHCKDTGHLLPGHGGLLDRLDSLIAAAPCFCILIGG
ncbi:MAG: phosphatidate cytidylyltransferase [Methylococcales bacterium]|nr:phosphatidate cytidylyltransferase [Methylococcales bacterium]